jgi:hypothetical protein
MGADGQNGASSGPVHWTRGELIGAGAFGRVYMGLNNETGQLMAVKQVCTALTIMFPLRILPLGMQVSDRSATSFAWRASLPSLP